MGCHCGCGGLPEHELMLFLEDIRERLGFPLKISSGYRCPAYNARVSRTGLTGPHTTGLAVDIKVWGNKALSLLGVATLDGASGIGVSQKGDESSRFIHVDIIEDEDTRPALWSY